MASKNQFRKPIYTQGPWEKTGSLDHLIVGHERKDGSFAWVAEVHTEHHNPPRYEEAEANAVLIVKSPDMYVLLGKIKSMFLSNPELEESSSNRKVMEDTYKLIHTIERELHAIKETTT